MTINLKGRVYTTVRDLSGAVLVIVQSSASMWRVASARDAVGVMRGLKICPLRVVK